MNHPQVKNFNLDFCAYGAPWRKRTKLVTWFWGGMPLRKICSSKGGGAISTTASACSSLERTPRGGFSGQRWLNPIPQNCAGSGASVLMTLSPREALTPLENCALKAVLFGVRGPFRVWLVLGLLSLGFFLPCLAARGGCSPAASRPAQTVLERRCSAKSVLSASGPLPARGLLSGQLFFAARLYPGRRPRRS